MCVYDFSIVTDEIHCGINHCFGNRSKSIPHTGYCCTDIRGDRTNPTGKPALTVSLPIYTLIWKNTSSLNL